MIFISLCELLYQIRLIQPEYKDDERMTQSEKDVLFSKTDLVLDGIRLFLINDLQVQYDFVGVDSSFQFFLVKESGEFILTAINSEVVIDKMKKAELLKSVWNSVERFISKFIDSMS